MDPIRLNSIFKKSATFPKDSLLAALVRLQNEFRKICGFDGTTNDTLRRRATWTIKQLTAFCRRIKIYFHNQLASFDEERQNFLMFTVSCL
jgi:hypothetical protein